MSQAGRETENKLGIQEIFCHTLQDPSRQTNTNHFTGHKTESYQPHYANDTYRSPEPIKADELMQMKPINGNPRNSRTSGYYRHYQDKQNDYDKNIFSKSMYRSEYCRTSVERPIAYKLRDNLTCGEGPMEKDSVYRSDYCGANVERPIASKVRDNLKCGEGPMEKESLYRSDYRGTNVDRPIAFKLRDNLHCGDGSMERDDCGTNLERPITSKLRCHFPKILDDMSSCRPIQGDKWASKVILASPDEFDLPTPASKKSCQVCSAVSVQCKCNTCLPSPQGFVCSEVSRNFCFRNSLTCCPFRHMSCDWPSCIYCSDGVLRSSAGLC